MPSLGLLLLVLTVLVGHAAPLQQSLSDIVLGQFTRAKAAPPNQCEDAGDRQGGKVTLYHYTDKAGYFGILSSGYIQKARPYKRKGGDSVYGKGIYFTALGPNNSNKKLAQNNWGGAASKYSYKLQYYFVCRIDRDDVCHAQKALDKGKDIWVVGGGHLNLKEANCKGRKRQGFY